MKRSGTDRILLLAVGNSGRQDDGLGWAFADSLSGFPGDIEYRYQLQVEDAELMSHYDRVIVVDACRGTDPEPFFWNACLPKGTFHFSTHALDPASVLFLCGQVYGRSPEMWLLGIRGEQWELRQGLSAAAKKNLAAAVHFLAERLPF